MRRTIMIFPKFANMDAIHGIRAKYDPLCDLVRPHVTLVFPFESTAPNDKLEKMLRDALKGIQPFELNLSGISKRADCYGNYLFLDVAKGKEELSELHRRLSAETVEDYIPHMTVGNLETATKMDDAFEKVKSLDEEFCTIVDTISVEMIGEHEESIIIMEIKLGQ